MIFRYCDIYKCNKRSIATCTAPNCGTRLCKKHIFINGYAGKIGHCWNKQHGTYFDLEVIVNLDKCVYES
jgi:hypothetical protein